MPKKEQKKKSVDLRMINKKLDTILQKQNDVSHEEQAIEGEERRIEQEQQTLAQEQEHLRGYQRESKQFHEKELSELERLEVLEKQIEKNVLDHPLRKITYQDVARGVVGSFFGAVAHYTFIYGLEIAEHISLLRASFLFVLTFVIGGVFLYLTGFRKIKDKRILLFLPLRLFVLYMTALIVTTIVLYVFMPAFGHDLVESYKAVSTVSLIAMIGAVTADLLGKE